MIKNFKTSTISGAKLKEARLSRGYSTAVLANIFGISAQAINKYERNVCQPGIEIFAKYITFLGFPREFFYDTPENNNTNATQILFRTQKTANDLDKDKLIVRSKWFQRIYDVVENYIDFPEVLIKQIGFQEYYDKNEIETLAIKARELLNVPNGPISNLTTIIENSGGIIVRMPVNVKKTDACSQWYNDRPLFFLTSDKMCAVRSRFDLAHELGHFFLHHLDETDIISKTDYNRMEKEADRFAGAFLLPANEFSKDIFSTSIQSFIHLKKRWKVSIGAMIYRCKDLNLLSESQIAYLWRQLAAKGYRTREPLDDTMIPEEPFILKSAIEMLDNEYILSPLQLNSIINLPINEISAICNIDPNKFNKNIPNKRIALKFIK